MFCKKGAIYYDYLLVNGGAEAVTRGMFEYFNTANLIVGGIHTDYLSTLDSNRINRLQSNISPGLLGNLQTLYRFKQFGTQAREPLDWHLYSGVYAPLAAQEHENNLYYCHTPPRFLFDLRAFYSAQFCGMGSLLVRSLETYYKPLYLQSLSRMNRIFVNSENVQKRLLTYTGFASEVLYPPCRVAEFGNSQVEAGDYYLSMGRLEPLKRIDVIVKAFRKMPDKKLVVMSGGSQLAHLRKLADGCPNISFTGWVDEEEYKSLVKRAICTIYLPVDEDFGMAPVESMAAGKPVIAVEEGGVCETVRHRSCGYLIPGTKDANTSGMIENLCSAVTWMSKERALSMKGPCEQRAQQFSDEQFYRALHTALEA